MVLKLRKIVKIIETKITTFIEPIMWNNKFTLTIIEGKINGIKDEEVDRELQP